MGLGLQLFPCGSRLGAVCVGLGLQLFPCGLRLGLQLFPRGSRLGLRLFPRGSRLGAVCVGLGPYRRLPVDDESGEHSADTDHRDQDADQLEPGHRFIFAGSCRTPRRLPSCPFGRAAAPGVMVGAAGIEPATPAV